MTATWIPADTFGARLVRLRHAARLTIEEAADSCGIKRATWRAWELEVNTPRDMAGVVDKVAHGLAREGLEVNRLWLMWGDATAQVPTNGGDEPPRESWLERTVAA